MSKGFSRDDNRDRSRRRRDDDHRNAQAMSEHQGRWQPPARRERFAEQQDAERRPQPQREAGPSQPGTVKMFNQDKGFGFIRPEDGSPDLFFHISKVVTPDAKSGLVRDARVNFSVGSGPKGPCAVNVELA